MKIYPVVEGQGEVSAMPVLLRRLIHDHASCYGVEIGSPVRRKAYEFTRKDAIKKAVSLAAMQRRDLFNRQVRCGINAIH